ncbi:hypothetical protein BBJ28_00023462 [Nothophytophthora sp. Chile5]|nr:hypothetical protein BBJ28_00023462 [Nothophytophthora sp. Chile5]
MDAAWLSRKRSFSELESQRLDDSLDALDVLGLNAPVLAVDLDDTATLFAEPLCSTDSPKRREMSVLTKSKGKQAFVQPKTPSHKHTKSHAASKKASKQQVHELQVMVNEMQVQVNGAAAEIQQLAQLPLSP